MREFQAVVMVTAGLSLAACGGGGYADPPTAERLENFGFFAVDDRGDMVRLDGDRDWEVATWDERSNFDSDIEFVVFDRAVATSPDPLPRLIRLYRVPGVRHEVAADGTVMRAAENRWVAVERDVFNVPVDFAPVPGRPDAVRVTPRAGLAPGLYSLQLHSGDYRKIARVGVRWPSVDTVAYAMGHCVDRIQGESTSYRLCSEEPPGFGLKIEMQSPRRQPSLMGDVLAVDGTIVNLSEAPRRVPPLVGTIEDSRGTEVLRWTFDSRIGELPPGETAHFRELVENPPPAASRVRLNFSEMTAAR